MTIRRVLSATLVAVLTVGAIPSQIAAQESVGVISGTADDTAKRPFTDYTVQLSDAATGEVVQTVKVDEFGGFSFSNVELSKRFLVELVNVKINHVICTEGPFVLTTPNASVRRDVNIDCGAPPAAWWLLVAGAGTAAAIAFAVASPSGATQ
jgi:hypothetical protein